MQVINPLLSHPTLLAYLSGADNYTWAYFRNGKRKLLAKPLTYFEKQLPDFVRIHKIALVNPAFVASVQPPARPKTGATVRLQDGTQLPVSRRRWQSVLETLQPQVVADPAAPEPDQPTGPVVPVQEPIPGSPPPVRVYGVMTGDARLLTEHCLTQLGLAGVLQCGPPDAALARTLRQTPAHERPALILIDARTEPAACLQVLQTIKQDPGLQTIPVIWLTAPGGSTGQAYGLDSNSVVAVSDDPATFVRTLTQLFAYWLFIVRFPV